MTAADAAQRIMEMVVSERKTIGRVRLPLHQGLIEGGPAPTEMTPGTPEADPTPPDDEAPPATSGAAETVVPDKALQVLTLAQRTAENHIIAANQHAQDVRSDAQASAENIRRDAEAYADQVRAETNLFLAEARAAVELRTREADAQVTAMRRQAESLLADAQTEAERIVADGQDRAEQLDLRALQRYEDAVGNLAIKREALQRQIEALAVFDADYRQRLASFMQNQLRALWVESPDDRGRSSIEMQLAGGPVGSPEHI